jgi:hypothetical protein
MLAVVAGGIENKVLRIRAVLSRRAVAIDVRRHTSTSRPDPSQPHRPDTLDPHTPRAHPTYHVRDAPLPERDMHVPVLCAHHGAHRAEGLSREGESVSMCLRGGVVYV